MATVKVTADEVIPSSPPRVYVSNFAGHDYTEAEVYGEIRSITQGFISFQSLDRLKFTIAQALQETTPDDWLLLSGTNIISVLASLLWYQKHGVVKILNFDKTTRKYREIIFNQEHITKLLEVLDE